jgi:hypothetical protein
LKALRFDGWLDPVSPVILTLSRGKNGNKGGNNGRSIEVAKRSYLLIWLHVANSLSSATFAFQNMRSDLPDLPNLPEILRLTRAKAFLFRVMCFI